MSAYLMSNYGNKPFSLVRGEGRYAWDSEGRRYLDALMGIAVCGLGHSHPAVTDTISRQAATLLHCSNLYGIPQQEDLAEKLCSVTAMEKVFFSNSGAEANEAAIKLSRLYGHSKGIENPTVLTLNGSFHGRTMATISATAGEKVKTGFRPLLEHFVHLPFNDISALAAQAEDDSVVAIMLEPIQGEAGVNIPDSGYLQKVRALCDANDWLLILDEVQTGNGRTGTHFACTGSHEGNRVSPDIITTAKGLGNGVPIGACMARGVAAELFAPGSHGSTYGGNPLVCSVANTVFDVIQDENLCARATILGNRLQDEFQSALVQLDVVKEVRNCGLMIAIEMHRDCPELVALAASAGLLINVASGNRVRLLPALNMTDSEADELVEKLCPVILSWGQNSSLTNDTKKGD